MRIVGIGIEPMDALAKFTLQELYSIVVSL